MFNRMYINTCKIYTHLLTLVDKGELGQHHLIFCYQMPQKPKTGTGRTLNRSDFFLSLNLPVSDSKGV